MLGAGARALITRGLARPHAAHGPGLENCLPISSTTTKPISPITAVCFRASNRRSSALPRPASPGRLHQQSSRRSPCGCSTDWA